MTYSSYPWIWSVHSAGGGCPFRNAVNRTSALAGCVPGTVCDPPLTVAKDRMSP